MGTKPRCATESFDSAALMSNGVTQHETAQPQVGSMLPSVMSPLR